MCCLIFKFCMNKFQYVSYNDILYMYVYMKVPLVTMFTHIPTLLRVRTLLQKMPQGWTCGSLMK